MASPRQRVEASYLEAVSRSTRSARLRSILQLRSLESDRFAATGNRVFPAAEARRIFVALLE